MEGPAKPPEVQPETVTAGAAGWSAESKPADLGLPLWDVNDSRINAIANGSPGVADMLAQVGNSSLLGYRAIQDMVTSPFPMRYIVDYQNYGSGGRGGYHWGNGEMYISPNNRMDDGSHVFTIHEALHAIRQPEGGGGRWEEANCYYISELLFYFLTGRMMYGSLARAYNAPWDAEKIVYDNPNADPPIFVPFTYEHHLNRLANIGDSPADAKAFVDRLPDRLKRPINPNNITQTLPDIVTLVAPRLEQDIGRRLAAHPDTGDLEFAPIK